VINELRHKSLKDDFGVAVIDKDKKEIDYLKDCIVVRELEKLIIWKHKSR